MNIILMIEELREELIKNGMDKGFQDPQVIMISEKLDDLINQYYRITSEVNIAS
ncbi:MAG: aspartyl-phosphate phosphatase Spo0E family protein [Syntrophomonas sp.]